MVKIVDRNEVKEVKVSLYYEPNGSVVVNVAKNGKRNNLMCITDHIIYMYPDDARSMGFTTYVKVEDV